MARSVSGGVCGAVVAAPRALLRISCLRVLAALQGEGIIREAKQQRHGCRQSPGLRAWSWLVYVVGVCAGCRALVLGNIGARAQSQSHPAP
jgi:hypothetical protein